MYRVHADVLDLSGWGMGMLTNTKIKRFRARDKIYREIDSDGLYIAIRPSGVKVWQLRVYKPKESIITLGEWPSLSIEDARLERDQLKKRENYGVVCFKEVANAWWLNKNYASEKNKKLEWRRIENYLLPTLGGMNMADIRPRHILPILKSIELSGHLELARRIRSLASYIFRYGIVNLFCDDDPAAMLVGATKKPVVKHFPAIVDEVGFSDLLRRIDDASYLMPQTKYALQFAPFVFVRSSELRLAVPSEFDFNKMLWSIPFSNMKKKRDHLVPLHKAAAVYVQRALQFGGDDFVFSGHRKGRPLSENTLNQALRSIGYAKEDITFHGFRSSFSTLAREVLRLDEDLIERQLAHVVGGAVKSIYDRSYKLEERTEMMNAWGDYLVYLKKG